MLSDKMQALWGNSRSRCLSIFLMTLLWLSIGAQTFTQGVELTVEGQGFTIKRLHNHSQAFANRKYLWQDIPAQFQGWQYTQTAGGESATIQAYGQQDGTIYIATVPSNIHLKKWQQIRKFVLRYSDRNHTSLQVYKRAIHKGEKIFIPQGNWTGTLILAPVINRQNSATETKTVPGVAINYRPAQTRYYIGSPSIAILPNGKYVASHDLFGPANTKAQTSIFQSNDRGKTWQHIKDIQGQWWSTLFVHQGALYLIGTNRSLGNIVIRKSLDGGRTWTIPRSMDTGLLSKDKGYHCAPVPIVVHNGRIWRAMEQRIPSRQRIRFAAFVMSAPINANLLQAKNWTFSNKLSYGEHWTGTNWLEGNVSITPKGEIVNILRLRYPGGEKAAMIHVSDNGRKASFNSSTDFIDFPGGSVKFTIRYDPKTKRYWSLVNQQKDPSAKRNILALTSSPDLRNWTVKAIVLKHPDREYHAFQYADWLFENEDLIFVSRTAFNHAHNYHDANYLTFHRVRNFRDLNN